jgi:hypothetical protein
VSGKKDVNVVINALDETVPGFKSARHHVQEFASEAKTLIAEAFVGFTIVEFFKGAIEKATEAEQSYAQLSNTLANVGVSYEHNRGQIEETIKSLQQVANVRTDDAIKGFNTLVQRSGDYKGSLDQMVLTADLAKAKHLEFNEAAELVGRVMGGNTRVLRQFGIVTKDAHDGLKQLRERIGGAAAADMATFGGQVEATKIKFYNLLEAVGDVITGNSKLGNGMSAVREGLESLTQYIEANKGTIGFWFTVIVAGVKELTSAFADVVRAAFYFGEAIGYAALAIQHAFSPEKQMEDLAHLKDAWHGLNKALSHDLVAAYERVGGAAATASEREAEGVQRTQAQLDEAARNNKARLAERAAAEEAARQKKADAEEKARLARIKAQDAAIQARLQLAEKLAAGNGTLAVGLAQLRLIEHAATEALKNGNLTWERRALLLERANQAHAARVKYHDPETEPTALEQMNRKDDRERNQQDHPNKAIEKIDDAAEIKATLDQIRAQAKQGAFVDRAAVEEGAHVSMVDRIGNAVDEHAKKLGSATEQWHTFGDAIADVVAGPIAGFSEGMGAAIGNMVTGSKLGGQAFEQAMKEAIAEVAKTEARQFQARALAGVAKAIGGNPAGVAEAAQWTAAAVAMYAVASIAGSSGGGGGGGGGGGPAASGGSGYTNQQSANSALLAGAHRGSLTIVFPGQRPVLDFADPADQDAFMAMVEHLGGTRNIEFQFGHS